MSFYFDHLSQAYELLRQAGAKEIQTEEALPAWFLEATGVTLGDGPELVFGLDHARLGDATLPVEAVDESARGADYPLGAYVTDARYTQVLLERLRFGEGSVVTWSTLKGGPAEFMRLLEVEGSYTVAMVESETRTVGLHLGTPEVGQRVRPRLVRLMRQGNAWRHGVAFEPITL